MIKCIYNTFTGRIYTFSRSEHDLLIWLDQFENAATIDLEELPPADRIFTYQVDLETLTLVEVQPIVRVGIPKQ